MDDRPLEIQQAESEALYTLRKRFAMTAAGGKPHTYDARCPAHDDKNKSLRVYRYNDRLYFHCYAGCSFNDVRRALSLPEWHGSKKPESIFRLGRKIEQPQEPSGDCPQYDFAKLAESFRLGWGEKIGQLAYELGVSVDSLIDGEVGRAEGVLMYSHKLRSEVPIYAWVWPMVDAGFRACGLRLRFQNGDKRSWTGSKPGLFVGRRWTQRGPVAICEGPTERAAVADWGFDAIGKPSCNDGDDLLQSLAWFDPNRGRDFVVFGQLDEAKERKDASGQTIGVFYPGQEGAEATAAAIWRPAGSVRVIFPPPGFKDFRQWLCAGATRADVDRLIASRKNYRPERLCTT